MATLLDYVADHIVLVDVAPEMNTHRLLTVEKRVRHTSHLAQHNICDGPCVGVLLEGSNIQSNGLFDDVVLAVRNQEGPVREMNDGGHDDNTCEERCVVLQLAGESDE